MGRRVLLLVSTLGLGALVVISEFTLCPFANITGHPCPGCGLTRATLALLQGDVKGALTLHPLIVVCLPVLAFAVLEGSASYLLARNMRWSARLQQALRVPENWLWGALAASLLVVWIARFCGLLGGPVSVRSGVDF